MVNWQQTHFIYEVVICSISMYLNIMVICFCNYHLGRAMKSYRWMLIGGSLVDISYTIISFFTGMLAIDYGTAMIFMSDQPFFPQTHNTAVIATILYCSISYTMIVNVCCQFVYRMNIFCLSNRFSLSEIFAFIGLLELWAIAHCCNIVNICTRYDEPEMTAALQNMPLFHNVTLPAYIFGDSFELKMMLQLLDSQLIVGAGYAIIIYCACRIEMKLRRDLHMLQPTTLAAQKQLSRIMMFQAFLPMPLLLLPIGMSDLLPMIGVSFEYLPVFIKVTISLLPLFNPIVIMITIPSIRRAILQCFTRGRVSHVTSTVSDTGAGLSTNKQPDGGTEGHALSVTA
ncbi:hypothetical protein M3Y98_01219000 [Aphelenchoides besseyi]|nr:hypothetical protein M3Y98_01219000 [Aphelenchoides besseyi]KAI6193319.1 hypothetical protein M3Y96_01005500 [Aphelenchoides besseyi]